MLNLVVVKQTRHMSRIDTSEHVPLQVQYGTDVDSGFSWKEVMREKRLLFIVTADCPLGEGLTSVLDLQLSERNSFSLYVCTEVVTVGRK